MGDHYIPRHYLKGFVEPNSNDQIWVYEKGKTEPFKTNIKKIVQANNYYPDSVESFLSREIESPTAPILKKIRDRIQPNPEEKFILSKYMSVLLKRVPGYRKRIEKWLPEIISMGYSNTEKKIKKYFDGSPETIKHQIDELKKLREKHEREFPKDVFQNFINPVPNWEIVLLLSKMKWIFHYVDSNSKLLTSDNPVFFFESYGIGSEKSEVTFPISSDIYLWATRGNDREGFFPVKEKIVKEINRRTAKNATKYLLYHTNQDWVIKLANKNNIKLTRIIGG